MTATALIVDDEVDLCRLMQLTLTRMGIGSDVAYDLATAHELLKNNSYDFCLTDMSLPDGSGLDLVKFINSQDWNMPVAVITAHGNMDIAIEALKLGAFDFVNKPLELPRLKQLVDNALKASQEATEQAIASDVEEKSPTQKLLDERLIGNSPVMVELKKTIVKLARSQAPVFLWGASGTGKEVVAKLIHDLSPRREGSFVPVNCGAIPSELMESEFFGHKKGSFTGATTDKQGLFQQANGGTLFLDEVADLPLAMQVKLLRAIQEKTVRAIGDTKEVPVDIRILSATHKDLNKLVQQGSFRQDLFYRINVIELKLPTLNQRADDIPMLAEHFLGLIVKDWQLEENLEIANDALEFLKTCGYDGNVRELRNLLERAVTMSEDNVIGINQLKRNQPTTGLANSEQLVTNQTNAQLANGQVNGDLQAMGPPSGSTATQADGSAPINSPTNASINSSGNATGNATANSATTKDSVAKSTVSTNYQNSGVQFVTSYSSNFGNSALSSLNTANSSDSSSNNSAVTDDNNDNLAEMSEEEAYQLLASKMMAGMNVKTGLPDIGLEEFLQNQEKIILINALNQTGWNKTKAARLLGMSLRSLRYRMDKLGVVAEE